MGKSPPQTHSFVVKVWEKEGGAQQGGVPWRGSITHVGTGERLYLENLREVSGFLAPYVRDLGGALDLRTRLCLWLTLAATGRESGS
jgi:hypothetical protein